MRKPYRIALGAWVVAFVAGSTGESSAREANASEAPPPPRIVTSSIDAGAFVGSAPHVVLHGTIAQPDAAVSSDGELVLWGGIEAPERTLIFRDGFEAGDSGAW